QLLAQSEQAHHLTQEEISEARRALQELQSQKDEIAKQILQVQMELAALDEVAARSKEEAERYQREQGQLIQSVAQMKEENERIDQQEQQLSLDLTDLEKK